MRYYALGSLNERPDVMPDAAEWRSLESVLRSLAAAARSLRLYPEASPIRLQSVEAVRAALNDYFTTEPDPLCISLAREGFSVGGESIGSATAGERELSDELRAHGAADMEIASALSGEELLVFLTVIARPVEEVRAKGGISALLREGGVENLRVTEVRLAVIEEDIGPDGDEDLLLRLADDPGALADWYAAAAAGDPTVFEAELVGLIDSAGADGEPLLVKLLGEVFKTQPPAGQDALLGLAMSPGAVRDLVGKLFEGFDAAQIAGSLLNGAFGKNMLILSNALSSLPLAEAAAEVRAEVEAMLPGAGHTSDEIDFLDHMLAVRALDEPEQPLVAYDRTYNAVLAAATLSGDDVDRAREAVAAAGRDISAAGVRAMLVLLDEQTDFERYCRSAENLAGTVPRLIEQGDLELASHVLSEIVTRQEHNAGPWPELSERLESALGVAAGSRSMRALVAAVAADPTRAGEATEIVRFTGEAGGPSLVAEAILLKDDGIAVAEQLLGRRVIDLLNAAAPDTPWHLLGPVVRRLAQEGDPRSVATVEALMERSDEQSRREVVAALASVPGPLANRLLTGALRDPRPQTAIAAARAIARSGEPGSAALLEARLNELDMDRTDYPLAKELIGALARTPGQEADNALAKLGSRRAFIRRGHFTDIQALVAEARKARTGAVSQ